MSAFAGIALSRKKIEKSRLNVERCASTGVPQNQKVLDLLLEKKLIFAEEQSSFVTSENFSFGCTRDLPTQSRRNRGSSKGVDLSF